MASQVWDSLYDPCALYLDPTHVLCIVIANLFCSAVKRADAVVSFTDPVSSSSFGKCLDYNVYLLDLSFSLIEMACLLRLLLKRTNVGR